jgi:hypothetical protein
MKYVSHLLLLAAVAVVMGVGMSRLISLGAKSGKGNLAQWILFELRRSQALEQRAAEIFRAMEVKKGIIGDLISKRVTLRDAVEGFRQADELIENHPDGLVATYRTAKSDSELVRQVFAWTRTMLSEKPSKTEKVMQRLEKERDELSRGEEKESEPRDDEGGSFLSPPPPLVSHPTH